MTVILDEGLRTVCENLPPSKKMTLDLRIIWCQEVSRIEKSDYCFLITKSGVSNIKLYKKNCKVNSFQYEFVFVCERACVSTYIHCFFFFFVIRARSICSGCTAAWRLIVLALCCSNCSNFHHQMSPRPTRRERFKQRKVEVLWARN